MAEMLRGADLLVCTWHVSAQARITRIVIDERVAELPPAAAAPPAIACGARRRARVLASSILSCRATPSSRTSSWLRMPTARVRYVASFVIVEQVRRIEAPAA